MTTPVIRSDTTTVAGAWFLNLGQPGNLLLITNPSKPVAAPNTLNVVVSSPAVTVRPTQ